MYDGTLKTFVNSEIRTRPSHKLYIIRFCNLWHSFWYDVPQAYIMWCIDPLLSRDLWSKERDGGRCLWRRGEHASATVELCNERGMGGYIRAVSGQRLGKKVPALTVTHATGEAGCCPFGPRLGVEKKRTWLTSSSWVLQEEQDRWRCSQLIVGRVESWVLHGRLW
jgi:hypothetical protein